MVEPSPGTPAALVRSLLATLLKAAITADDHHSQAWREEARDVRRQVLAVPSGLEDLKIDGLWWLAIGDAQAPELEAEQKAIKWAQPKPCPVTIAKISAPDFDVDLTVRTLKESAATG